MIQPEYASRFEKRFGQFWDELVRLHLNLYYLEKILEFPRRELAIHPDNHLFLDHVVGVLVDSSLLSVSRMTDDAEPDTDTILRFKNDVVRWLDPAAAPAAKERLKKVRFDKRTRDIRERIRKIRNRAVAHKLPSRETVSVTFGELQLVKDALRALLEAIAFRGDLLLLPLPYLADARRRPHEPEVGTDIYHILNAVADTGPFLSHLDRNPDLWDDLHDISTPERIDAINTYRNRIGLRTLPPRPEAAPVGEKQGQVSQRRSLVKARAARKPLA